MKRALLLACLLMAGCPDDGSSGIYIPGFTAPSSTKATPTPKPGTATPTPKPGVTPTPKPGVTPTPIPGTVTPTPPPGYANPKVQLGALTDTWSISEPMSTLRVGLVAWVSNGKIYAADGDGYGTVEEYLPSQGTWKAQGYYKESHYFGVAGLIDGKLYQAAGFAGDVYYDQVLSFTPASGSAVEVGPTIPSADTVLGALARGRSHAGGGVLTDSLGIPYLYLYGGTVDNYVFNQLVRYRPPQGSGTTGTWEIKNPSGGPSPAPSMAAMGSGVLDNTLYLVGGYDAQHTVLDTVLAYNPASNAWVEYGLIAKIKKARHSLMVASLNGYLYAIGGADANNKVLGDVERYDPMTNTWQTCASLPTPRALGAAVTLNNRIYVLGGYDQSGRAVRTVEVYNP